MRADAVVETFLALAAIPSPSGDERAVADAVLARLAPMASEVVEDGVAAAIGGSAGNIRAWLPPTVDGEPILLCAHLDTVESGATVRPLVRDGVVVAAEGRILGADDKAAIAAILDALARVRATGVEHAGVEVLFTVQEELGLAGARAAELGGLRARRAVIVDYSGPIGVVVDRAPSYLQATLAFVGRAAHASQPELGANAILAAGAALAALPAAPEGVTANVGLIRGGSGVNVVADRAEVELEVRGFDHGIAEGHLAAIEAAARAAAIAAGCELRVHARELYRAYAHEGRGLIDETERALAAIGRPPRRVPVFGGSDANALNAAGIDAVTLAGGMFDIHSPEERIAVADLAALSDLFVELIAATGRSAR